MDCPRGLPTFFQYGAGTSGAAAAPRVPAPGAAAAPQVPAPGAAAARPGCRGAAPEVPRRHPRCRGGTSGAAAAPRVPGGGSSGAAAAPGAGTSGAAAAPRCVPRYDEGRRGDCYRDTLEVRSRCESPSRISPRRGTRARHLRCRPGSRARHLGCPNLRGGEKPAAGRGTSGPAAPYPITGTTYGTPLPKLLSPKVRG